MAAGVTPKLTVAIPVLWRPHRVKEVLGYYDVNVQVLFLPDESDTETIDELNRHQADWSISHEAEAFGCQTYETKVNHAYEVTRTPYLMYASDDVRPHDGALALAVQKMDARPNIGLLATNDLNHHMSKIGLLATHGILRRAYVEEYGSASLEGSGPVFHEGYRHWNCDVEVSCAALRRRRMGFSPDVVVKHARKSLPNDRTYALGAKWVEHDRALRAKRCPEWPGR